MMTVWRHIAILVPVLIIFIVVVVFVLPQNVVDEPNGEEDDSFRQYLKIKDYITPDDFRVSYNLKEVLGINKDKNLTITDIVVIQDWLANNFALKTTPITYPNDTLNASSGNHLSLHLLEYSMLLLENNKTKYETFILLIDLMYDGDTYTREHSATITFFNDKAFLSDVTIPADKIGYVCRLNRADRVISDIIENTYVIRYDVKYAFSEGEQVAFSDNDFFFDWLLLKTGYG